MTDLREAFARIAREDPELAARLVLQTLPATAARIEGPLSFALAIDELGEWTVSVDGTVSVERGSNGALDFIVRTDAAGLAALAAGESAFRLFVRNRLHVDGRRRKALRLRALGDGEPPTLAEALAAGAELDAGAVFGSLAYLIDPEWTRGHSFTVLYEVSGEGGGRWAVTVDDARPVTVSSQPPATGADVTLRLGIDVFRRLASGELTPDAAMRGQLVDVQGKIYAATMLGRWIERSQGRDDEELERERRQRELQARRAGSWGGAANGRALPVSGTAGGEAPGDRRSAELMSYGELYALWERQNWRAHELDFSVDREHWLASSTEGQRNMTWSLGSFYIGEERVTADLAPLLLGAPSGEVEAFLATQLVDEARHAVFFDRFGAEVMALGADDLRGRLRELQDLMLGPWFDVFDAGLRDVAERVKRNPDDLALFVEAITTYHMVIEGVLAMTGQRFILNYFEQHGLYPGFRQGFSLVERDEHRHIAFGVRFLRDAIQQDPALGDIVRGRVEELVPRAMLVFKPPYVDDARDFVAYGNSSREIYGYAYRKLKRRMTLLGLDLSAPEALMPGPIASVEEARAAGAPV